MITFRTSTDSNVRFDKQSYRELLLFFLFSYERLFEVLPHRDFIVLKIFAETPYKAYIKHNR